MLFHRLKLSGLLSFGPEGVDLPMECLNVLIGQNGSGKSNFLEALALFQSAPRDLSDGVSRLGGLRDSLWKGPDAQDTIAMEAEVSFPPGGALRHAITLTSRNERLVVSDESVEPTESHSDAQNALDYYRPPRDKKVALEISEANKKAEDEDRRRNVKEGEWSTPRVAAVGGGGSIHFASDFEPGESLLANFSSPDHPALMHLGKMYRGIRLYRDWSFGPSANFRQPHDTHTRGDFLDEKIGNLSVVLSRFLHGEHKRKFIAALRKLFHGIVDIQFEIAGGAVALHIEEEGDRVISATRLSDGTLRYLCLLAILLHPDPPPLICIEEPELGLHPDLLPTLSDLMVEASRRSQLVVTTHSGLLVDALTDRPESVVVCEKHEGRTEMRRLDRADLDGWLKQYGGLGDAWASGELGGNRW